MKLNDILSGQFNAAEWEAKGYQLPKFDIAKVREKISDGDKDIDMEDIDDVVINVAKSDEPVVVVHDEVDVDDDEEDTRFDGLDEEE